jgi:hypothetical protein
MTYAFVETTPDIRLKLSKADMKMLPELMVTARKYVSTIHNQ